MILQRCREPPLRQVLIHTCDNYLRAGEIFGINRVTLKRWVEEHGFSSGDDPAADYEVSSKRSQ